MEIPSTHSAANKKKVSFRWWEGECKRGGGDEEGEEEVNKLPVMNCPLARVRRGVRLQPERGLPAMPVLRHHGLQRHLRLLQGLLRALLHLQGVLG